MNSIKEKLFGSCDQDDNGPCKEEYQKGNKLFDQFGVHKSSFF